MKTIMKKCVLIFPLLFIAFLTTAQMSQQKILNIGIGLGAYTAGGIPIGVSFELPLKENNISVGGSIDYARYGYNYDGYKWNYTFFYFGARASYHAAKALSITDDKFDPYIGFSLGFRTSSYSDNYGYGNYSSPYSSGLFLGTHLGARYLFSDKIGGFAEVGYGVSVLRIGMTLSF
jgi:hypothetical protein